MFLLLIVNRHKIAFHKYNQTKDKNKKVLKLYMFIERVYIGITEYCYFTCRFSSFNKVK